MFSEDNLSNLNYLRDNSTYSINIFQRRSYISNTSKSSLNIAAGGNRSGKTFLLRKMSLNEVNFRPTIIICSDSMALQYKDLVVKAYKFGKDLFHPPIPSPLHSADNHFELTVNSLFREHPFSPHMKSRMRKVLLDKLPNSTTLGKSELKILHNSVKLEDEALKSRFNHLRSFIGNPALVSEVVESFSHYSKPFLISFDSPEAGNLLIIINLLRVLLEFFSADFDIICSLDILILKRIFFNIFPKQFCSFCRYFLNSSGL